MSLSGRERAGKKRRKIQSRMKWWMTRRLIDLVVGAEEDQKVLAVRSGYVLTDQLQAEAIHREDQVDSVR